MSNEVSKAVTAMDLMANPDKFEAMIPIEEAFAIVDRTLTGARPAGELVPVLTPRPLVTMADLSRYRVRAEIDERDVGKVTVGQAALVTADAFGEQRISGNVSEIRHIMGRKEVRTGDPAEKSDRDISPFFPETAISVSD